MSLAATTNRASEMWNNHTDVNTQSVRQPKQNGYKQYPTMSPEYYNYQNNYYAQSCDYSNTISAGYGKPYGQNQSEQVVKSEPSPWQGYHPNYMNGSQTNMEMINRWREMNYYAQQQPQQYGYDQRMNPVSQISNNLELKHEDARMISSPGQCSIPETSYGSPQSTTSNLKPPTPEVDDCPKLRALVSKPRNKEPSPYFVKCDKSYTQDMLQRIMFNPEEISDWEKNNGTTEKESNLSQFHGGYETVESQTSIKKDAVGGAAEGAQSSQESAEPCQDVTRVEAGGDNADYAENKMAAAHDVQAFYPWMKSVNGMLNYLFYKTAPIGYTITNILVMFYEYKQIIFCLFQVTIKRRDQNERDKPTRDFRPWSWKRSFTSTSTYPEDDGLKCHMHWVSQSGRSKFGSRTEE